MLNRSVTRYHQGIRIDNIPASGFAGLLFLVAATLLFLSIPQVREFFLVVLIGVVPTTAALHFWHKQTRW